MRAAITGGRHRTPSPSEMAVFWSLVEHYAITEIAHGDYPDDRGTDRYVGRAARQAGLYVQPYPVKQAIDGPWPGAGPRRNGRMLRSLDLNFQPVALLIAFPGGRGTADCTKQARLMGLVVEVIPEIP